MNNDNDDLNFQVVIKLRDSLFSCPSASEKEHRPFCNEYAKVGHKLNKASLGRRMSPLFKTVSAEKVKKLVEKAKRLDVAYTPPNFLTYYCMNCDDEYQARNILKRLAKVDSVELCYVESHLGGPPFVNANANPLSSSQKYLNRGPVGIDARYAWVFPGGDGGGDVKFVDIEQGWFLDHEDLSAHSIRATGLNHWEHKDHGAAVLGVIAMRDNTKGGVGITPSANAFVVSQWRKDGSFNTADAIMAALDYLRFGDILLLEAQVFDVFGTKEMWPIEVLEANFQAIRLANALGIIVIEPAGNGMYFKGNDLDKFTDLQGQQVFNRLKACFKDSGAIVVAAASSGVPHSRVSCSNYGSRVDCYAWGEDVATAGASPHSSGGCTDTYSLDFGGTSSASAIIAGAAIAVQSISETNYNSRMSPPQMRSILSSRLYGTNSANGHRVDKIGVMPDLRKIIHRALKIAPLREERLQKKTRKKVN